MDEIMRMMISIIHVLDGSSPHQKLSCVTKPQFAFFVLISVQKHKSLGHGVFAL